MKKFQQSVVMRALSLLVLGVIFIVFSKEVSDWSVIVTGSFFVLTGVMAMLTYWWQRKKNPSLLYPVVAVGAAAFGVVLILFPDLFLGALLNCLAGFLAVIALVQIFTLWKVNQAGVKLPFYCNLVPLLEVGAAAGVFFYKGFTPEDPRAFTLLGSALVIYGLFEVFLSVALKREEKRRALLEKQKGEQKQQDLQKREKQKGEQLEKDSKSAPQLLSDEGQPVVEKQDQQIAASKEA